jgi:hypothetical protein
MARYCTINWQLKMRPGATVEAGFLPGMLKPFQFLLKPGAFLHHPMEERE